MDVFGFAERIKEKAKQTLIKDGTHVPMIFCLTPDKVCLIPLQMENDIEKMIIMAKVKQIMEKHNVWAYIVIMKAWMVTGKGKKIDPSIRPSQSPDRVNILMVSAITHKRKKMWSIPVENKHGRIEFGEEKVLDTKTKGESTGGLFMDLLGNIH